MEMESILQPEQILFSDKLTSRKRLFKEVAERAEKITGIDSELLNKALWAREDLGSTAMGGGIAIPHARIEGIEQVFGIFVRLQDPIDFDAADRQEVDLAFVIFAPEATGVEHLKALARVSRTLRDENIKEKLRSTENQRALYTILTQPQGATVAA